MMTKRQQTRSASILNAARKLLGGGHDAGTDRPHNTTAFDARAIPSPLVVEVFEKIRHFPGWFNIDDCAHFSLILSLQRVMGLHGDVLEIGCYHGRSTCLLARHLAPNEKLHVCDVFDLNAGETYQSPPTEESLWRNISAVNPELPRDCIVTHRCTSNQLTFPSEQRFRFIHVDGGHEKKTALFDMTLSANHLIRGGVMAVDDYHHPDFPGVTEAVDEFLTSHNEYVVTADLNRHGAIGRKVYLCTPVDA